VLDAGAGKGDMLVTNMDEETSSSTQTALRKNKYRMSRVKCFGVDLSPDNVAVAMVFCTRCFRPCEACSQFLLEGRFASRSCRGMSS